MLDKLKYEAWLANRELFKNKLVRFNMGGISVADRENGVFAIKPQDVGFDELVPENFIIIDMNGTFAQGASPADDWRVHLSFYKMTEAGSVAHIVSENALAFAAAGKPVPIFSAVHAQTFGAEIPVTRPLTREEIEGDYDVARAVLVKEATGGRGCALLTGHEGYALAKNAQEALYSSLLMEDAAKTAISALALTPGLAPLSTAIINKVHKA